MHCNMQAPGSQPDPWGTMTPGAYLSTFLREGPVSGPTMTYPGLAVFLILGI
jgi:hypothetical protein